MYIYIYIYVYIYIYIYIHIYIRIPAVSFTHPAKRAQASERIISLYLYMQYMLIGIFVTSSYSKMYLYTYLRFPRAI